MLLNIIPVKENAFAVTQHLLRQLKVKATNTGIKQNIENHPNHQSIIAISDCLTAFNVENSTYLISDEDYPSELLYPFVAHITPRGGSFLLVHNINNREVTFSNENEINSKMPEAEFLKVWSRVALHATAKTDSGEETFSQNAFKEFLRVTMVPLLFLTLAILFYNAYTNRLLSWPIIILNVLKLSGVVISILLLIQSINVNNPFIKNLCKLNGKSDCNAILNSEAAKVTSWLSWSEVGFFYFTGSFLSLLFAYQSFSILAWLNLLALPYTIYSISYQFRNRNWCILCCSVQILLVLEASMFLIEKNYLLHVSPGQWLLVIVSFLLPILSWSFLKPFFIDASQSKSLKIQLKKFKYNKDLFDQALTNQPRYGLWDNFIPVLLGNPMAETVITIVSDPLCGPCARAHKTLSSWLKNRDDFQLKIIFTTDNDESGVKTKLASHLIALCQHENNMLLEEAMSSWYSSTNKNYDLWAKKYPVEMHQDFRTALKHQNEWCDFAEITLTPTIFINGYRLPDPYRLEDITHLLN